METERLWVLGASDPEMSAIEALLAAHGERYRYAMRAGRRVAPAEAIWPDDISPAFVTTARCVDVYDVECRSTDAMRRHTTWPYTRMRTIDHHAPGDPGYGRPPAEYWAASSLGQVVAALESVGVRVDVTDHMRMVAAADHCLSAAYRGECPGVDPDALMAWRVESRAAHQGRPASAILADIAAAREALRAAPEIELAPGVRVRDMRRDVPVPELPEAAAREGVGYISGPLASPDGRNKFTCSGSPEQVRAWLDAWAPAAGIVDTYGDPARGFAGGYAP